MGKSTPQAPPAPDPRVTGAAQTASNVNTSIANSVTGNANQYGPQGSTVFTENPGGGRTISDGNGGQIYVPQYNQTTTLSPEQQQLYNQQTQLGGKLNQLAINQTDQIGNIIGTPATAPSGDIQRSVGTSDQFSADAQRAQDAIMSRLAPQQQRERDALNTQLLNQGFTAGSSGYDTGIDAYNRSANDAKQQAVLAGYQVQGQLQGENVAAGQFANSAYDQALKDELALRNQPINEVSALMSGGQVSLPQVQGFQGGQVAGTPIGDYINQSAALNNANYQQQLQSRAQQTAGLYGGLGSVAGAGLYGAFRYSDRRVKTAVHRIGEWFNGLPLYLFKYIWDPNTIHMGFMAQDVEKVNPAAVSTINGIKVVNYELARV